MELPRENTVESLDLFVNGPRHELVDDFKSRSVTRTL